LNEKNQINEWDVTKLRREIQISARAASRAGDDGRGKMTKIFH